MRVWISGPVVPLNAPFRVYVAATHSRAEMMGIAARDACCNKEHITTKQSFDLRPESKPLHICGQYLNRY